MKNVSTQVKKATSFNIQYTSQ